MKMLEPSLLLLELTNRCNALPRCVYCPSLYSPREPQDMDFDLYKRIIDSCPSSKRLHPQNLGEPLLYPHFIEAIAYAERKGIDVCLYTNASLLDNNMSEQLLNTGIEEIRFSVDGHNKTTYEASRPGLSWKTVLDNIENFQRLKNQGGYSTRTVIRMCVIERTESLQKDILDFWRKHVDVVSAIREIYVPLPVELAGRKTVSGEPINCEKAFQHLSVASNGELILCCRDRYGSYLTTDLNKETDILKAYNNEQFQRIRTALHEGKGYPYLCHVCREPVKMGTKFER